MIGGHFMVINLKLHSRNQFIHPDSGKILFHYSDIETIPEWPDGPLIELVNGELFMVPSPGVKHQQVAGTLFAILSSHVKKQGSGKVFFTPIDVHFSDDSVVIPDLLFVATEHEGNIKAKLIEGAPDLIVEILSSNVEMDKSIKKQLYQQFRVKEYWIVDPENETLEIFVLDDQSRTYAESRAFSGEQQVESMIFPELDFVTSKIFEE
jgi:Uma2 family endonuclease